MKTTKKGPFYLLMEQRAVNQTEQTLQIEESISASLCQFYVYRLRRPFYKNEDCVHIFNYSN